jgi:GTPase SAR1 family protein
VWDNTCADRFEALPQSYFRNASAAIVCFDLTDSASFDHAKSSLARANECAPGCILVLVGTKLDLILSGHSRGVSAFVSENYARSLGSAYYECSARTDTLASDAAAAAAAAPVASHATAPFRDVARTIFQRAAARQRAGVQAAPLDEDGVIDVGAAPVADGDSAHARCF